MQIFHVVAAADRAPVDQDVGDCSTARGFEERGLQARAVLVEVQFDDVGGWGYCVEVEEDVLGHY